MTKVSDKSYFSIRNTVHTARTIMLDEITKLMHFSSNESDYVRALNDNVSGKLTQKNLQRTNAALVKLYSLNNKFFPFICFKHFWDLSPEDQQPLLVLLYASAMDFMVYETMETVIQTPIGSSILSNQFANIIEQSHGNDYSIKTIASASRNLISTYRQVGLLSGSSKNIRTAVKSGIQAFAFACLMAYFNDDRGEFILQSKWVRILNLNNTRLKELAAEASIKGLMEFKYAGSVVTISFNNLFTTLGLYGIESR